MLRIGICDDSLTELEIISMYMDDFTRTHREYALSAYAFRSPIALLDFIAKEGAFDILLLDVIMAGLDGIEVGREVRAKGDPCEILYLTSSREYAVEAFGVGAVHYLLKPVSKVEFSKALLNVIERLSCRHTRYMLKKTDKGIRKIDYNDILFIESDRHHQGIHLKNGERITVSDTLGALFEEMKDASGFFMPHRAFIVNMDYITNMTLKELILSDGSAVPIPKGAYAKVRDLYVHYFLSHTGRGD